MFGDKQYAKQPYKYPTPSEIPEDTGCRTFQIPSDPAWFALFMGALYPLTLPESFQQNEGGLSVETTAEIFQDLIELTYANAENGCVFCTQPGGEPIVRLDEDGYFQQLVDSEWLPPEGEYEIPPTPEREEPTDEEKRCAAAANATNVMKVLYETLADDYGEGLTLAEAIAHFIAVAAALIFLPGGLIAAAIALALVVFRIMFETAEFVTADYWTTEFDEKFQCSLYECSSVDGAGVVTFDYVCFQETLSRTINALEDPYEVVLWGQIQAMLSFLGTDALNLAGGTTAIESADCSTCPWCLEWLPSEDLGTDWSAVVGTYFTYGTYSGGGWNSASGLNSNGVTMERAVAIEKSYAPTTIIHVEITYDRSASTWTGAVPAVVIYSRLGATWTTLASTTANLNGTDLVYSWSGSLSSEYVTPQVRSAWAGTGGSARITKVVMRGTGTPPTGGVVCN